MEERSRVEDTNGGIWVRIEGSKEMVWFKEVGLVLCEASSMLNRMNK